jgi:hypothetical protein
MADDEAPLLALDPQLARLEHAAVVIGEDGQQNRVPQLRFRRIPVHVEVAGVAARRAVLEHVPPQLVLAMDGHVVRNDVQELPQVVPPQGAAEALVRLTPPELGIHLMVVDDVVAVRAAGDGFQVGRAVEMTDAQVLQVRRDRGRRIEAETGVQLDAVRGARLGGEGHRTLGCKRHAHGPSAGVAREGLQGTRAERGDLGLLAGRGIDERRALERPSQEQELPPRQLHGHTLATPLDFHAAPPDERYL